MPHPLFFRIIVTNKIKQNKTLVNTVNCNEDVEPVTEPLAIARMLCEYFGGHGMRIDRRAQSEKQTGSSQTVRLINLSGSLYMASLGIQGT